MRVFHTNRFRRPAALALIAASLLGLGAARAQVPPDGGFSKPLKCTLDRDCWIVNLPDAAGDEKVKDYRCGPRSYNGHKGTDFAIRDFRAIDEGADVVAAAPGRVAAARDGAGEFYKQTPETRRQIGRKECGNGVVVRHAGGWESRYCHLRTGSVAVEPGDRVKRGDVLGRVGMSGRTEFPHVHIELRVGGRTIDPFSGEPVGVGCGRPRRPLWKADAGIRYPGLALYAAGFTDHTPNSDRIRSSARSPAVLARHAPALVLWAAMYGVRRGDAVKLRILDPSGAVATAHEIRFDRTQSWRWVSTGRKLPVSGWAVGPWKGEATLQRVVDGRTVTRSIDVPLVIE